MAGETSEHLEMRNPK